MRNEKMQIALFLISVLSCTACVNNIQDDIQEGTVPISFSSKVSKSSTRATEKAFSRGDKVGVFAMLASTGIEEYRYIDNLRLECGENSELIPEKVVFYPEGDNSLDFISYHPYRKDGLPQGSALLEVSVETDQSSVAGHSDSNFMTASAKNVDSSNEYVELIYKHQFTKIKIKIQPGKTESADEILASNLKITASGFHTRAMYNLQKGTLSDLTEVTDILPYGNWKKESDGTLTGKEFIIIPQATNEEQTLHLDWNGTVYTCKMPDIAVKGDTECEVDINALQNASHILTGIAGSIKKWEQGETGESENQYILNSVHIAALSFSNSDIYRVYCQSMPVAEICKEYLWAADESIQARAIVVYPVKEEKADLQQGKVLQILDEDGKIHGGTANWNSETNSLTYTPGDAEPINCFYIDENRAISYEKPQTSSAINISSYRIRDIRNGQLQTYPIVKIGTQYWMKEDLCATSYRDGKALTLRTALGKGAGYFKNKEENIFLYNGEALLQGELAPDGWKIPAKSDWDKLVVYISNNAAVLKKGTWKAFNDGTVCPVTNLTDLSILPNGMFGINDGVHLHTNLNTTAAYWMSGDAENILAEKGIYLLGGSNEVQEGTNVEPIDGSYRGLSIRCIKE